MASRSYSSGTNQSSKRADITFDYQEIRAAVADYHNTANFRLSLLLLACLAALLYTTSALLATYRKSSRYCRLYQLDPSLRAFLRGNVAANVIAAQRQALEKRQGEEEKLRQEERLRLLRLEWVSNLRSALPDLKDEQLRAKVEECLQAQPADVDQMEALWLEIQGQAGQKTPAERLSLLLESIKPFCEEPEFERCRTEAFAILGKAGFRAARQFSVTMHDELKMRARELEELQKNGREPCAALPASNETPRTS
jgi:hypothetical protein